MVNIPGFPFSPSFDLSSPSASSAVLVGPPVPLTFFDKSLLNERFEIGIEPIMMDFLFVVVLKLVFDRESVGVIKSGNYVQQNCPVCLARVATWEGLLSSGEDITRTSGRASKRDAHYRESRRKPRASAWGG